ncbi:MAG: hypothetical protein KAU26_02075 [Methylococcales bacterium]|nr:hypothetical protein [Methylococcales bacterium]
MSKETPLLADHYYHIYNRGINGVDLFFEERNYCYFLKLYAQHIYPIAKTYAYCLMKNHFHFLVSIRSDLTGLKNLSGLVTAPKSDINPSKHFSNFFNAYSKSINKAYQRTGSLFERPFKRINVNSDNYFVHLVSYIHRNPQKHNFVDDFRLYPHSSYLALYQQQLNSRLETKSVFNWFGSLQHFETYHLQFNDTIINHLIEDDY